MTDKLRTQTLAAMNRIIAAKGSEPLLWNYPKDPSIEGYMVLVTNPSVSPFNKTRVEPGVYPHSIFSKITGMPVDGVYPLNLSPTISVLIGTPAPSSNAGGFTVKSPTDSVHVPRPLIDKFISEGYLVPESKF